MTIRAIELEDLEVVSALCMAAFTGSVAPTLSDQGIETFQAIASVESFSRRMNEDNKILVYEEDGKVIGVIELKKGSHIAMLFVSPTHQKRGVGKSLVSAIAPYFKESVITVSASLTSVPAYTAYGFKCDGEVAESEGLIYQPMKLKL